VAEKGKKKSQAIMETKQGLMQEQQVEVKVLRLKERQGT